MEKYLNGKKWVATSPTTIVEFTIPTDILKKLFTIQHKAEDGSLSHGLGSKAGKTLEIFNENIKSFRIIKVKRYINK